MAAVTGAPRGGPRADAVAVAVVTYNCRALAVRCVESLLAFERGVEPGDVWIVDNASSDGTVEALRARFPQVNVVALPTNAGFSRANNIAFARTDTPFVALVNPDVEFREPVLDRLREVMDERPDLGRVGPRPLQPDGTLDHACKRSFPTPLAALAHFTRLGRARWAPPGLAQYRAPDLPEEGSGPVDALNGAFMLCRRDAIDAVGGLDEGYWLYMEDLDWCYRFHRAGWGVRYEGGVTALHAKAGTSGKHRRLRQNYAFHRGMGRFYRKFQAGRRPLLDAAVYAGIALKFAASAARGAVARRRLRA